MINTTLVTDRGEEAQRRLTEIARCSENADGVTRLPYTPEHQSALKIIRAWMQQAGLTCQLDAAGTLVGRKQGPEGSPTLLIGSHQDSVRHGGRYDGIMGVALGCLALQKLAEDGINLPVSVEVLAFADEEGVRFPTALTGPRALAGTLDRQVLQMTDQTGESLADALTAFGGDASSIDRLGRDPATILGYLEIHLEQGPVLEKQGVPLGIVTGICGIERNKVTLTGETGHAGTVPMGGRRDALVAASQFIAEISEMASSIDNLRATVGSLTLRPNVVNAIPGEVELSLEIRSLDDTVRREFANAARALGKTISKDRSVSFDISQTYEQPAVPCSDVMMRGLEQAAIETEHAAFRLLSGATHDASAMADLCPIGMVFVRCRDGISHTPQEFVSSADMGAAIEVVSAYLQSITLEQSAGAFPDYPNRDARVLES